jgi:hypothetical protein
MSDFFAFRDSLEPEASSGLQAQTGGGAGNTAAGDLVDFDVHATDGNLGKVEDVAQGPGESYVIVRTGSSLLSKKVMLPAGLIERIDREGKTVHVDRTTDEIKAAPEFDEERYKELTYRDELAAHYGR